MYLRKSSESEERQELSIPAQLHELCELAARRGLAVVSEPLEEAMSAKRPGRPVFRRLVDGLARGDADGIICWKLDRLARNPVDGGELMYALGEGVFREIVTPGRTYTGTGEDKLLMSIEFGMATKYSDDLSANVRRGNREHLQQGFWPGYPKLGYIRDRETMKLIPDPERFHLVREMWRLLIAGVPVLDILEKASEEWQLRTPVHKGRGGKPVPKSQIYRLFRDEFYAGWMRRKEGRFRGSHAPMISEAEFMAAQDRLDGRLRPTARPKRLFFAYRGLITCGSCRALVTAKHVCFRQGCVASRALRGRLCEGPFPGAGAIATLRPRRHSIR